MRRILFLLVVASAVSGCTVHEDFAIGTLGHPPIAPYGAPVAMGPAYPVAPSRIVGGCQPGSMPVLENGVPVSCNRHETNPAALANYGESLATFCAGKHGQVDRMIAPGAIAHYDCP